MKMRRNKPAKDHCIILKHWEMRTLFMNNSLWYVSLYIYLHLDLNKQTGLEQYFQMEVFLSKASKQNNNNNNNYQSTLNVKFCIISNWACQSKVACGWTWLSPTSQFHIWSAWNLYFFRTWKRSVMAQHNSLFKFHSSTFWQLIYLNLHWPLKTFGL